MQTKQKNPQTTKKPKTELQLCRLIHISRWEQRRHKVSPKPLAHGAAWLQSDQQLESILPVILLYYFLEILNLLFIISKLLYIRDLQAPSTGIKPATCQGLCAAGRLLSGEGASGRNDPQLPVSSTRSRHIAFNAFTLCICSFCLFASRRSDDVSLTGNMGNVCVLVQFLLYFASFSTASSLGEGKFVVFMHIQSRI